MLKQRKDPKAMNKYYDDVEKKRNAATREQVTKWGFQKDPNADPLIKWKKMRDSGEIGNLKTGYGTDGEKRAMRAETPSTRPSTPRFTTPRC